MSRLMNNKDFQIKSLKKGILNNLKEVLNALKLNKLYESEDKLIGACPVHTGDNETAFNINIDETSDFYGCWYCNTGHCHENYGNDIIGLATALFENNGSKNAFVEAINFLSKFDKGESQSFIIDNTEYLNNLFKPKIIDVKPEINRDYIRKKLKIPCQYYLNRGFSKKILDDFDVGLCESKDTQMYMRAVFPVYDESGNSMVGCVGRSIYENNSHKWKNSKGFNKGSFLYGFHKAREAAIGFDSIVLVEGQGDVLRMHESGLINSVGLFGCLLTDDQGKCLERLGISNLLWL
jgi:hypothetical protein